jgi:hypothetical protein
LLLLEVHQSLGSPKAIAPASHKECLNISMQIESVEKANGLVSTGINASGIPKTAPTNIQTTSPMFEDII